MEDATMNGTLLHYINHFGPTSSKHELSQGIRALTIMLHNDDVIDHLNACVFDFREEVIAKVAQHKADTSPKKSDILEIPLPFYTNQKREEIPAKLDLVTTIGCYTTLLKDLHKATGYYFIYKDRDQRVEVESGLMKGASLLARATPLDGQS